MKSNKIEAAKNFLFRHFGTVNQPDVAPELLTIYEALDELENKPTAIPESHLKLRKFPSI